MSTILDLSDFIKQPNLNSAFLSKNNFSISLLLFCGHIANKADLQKSLNLPAGIISNADILIHCYQKWGDRFANQLRGAFAFVLMDYKNHKIICARDHFGIQPLYYHYQPNNTLIFSTKLATLKPYIKQLDYDDEYLLEMLSFGLCSEHRYLDNTCYQQIKRVKPAHVFIFSKKHLSVKNYWPIEELGAIKYKKHVDYFDHFYMLFEQAVNRSTEPYQKIALELSGGLDSACIAAMATRSSNKEYIALTNTTPNSMDKAYHSFKSECSYAKQICNFLQLKQYIFKGNYSFQKTFERLKKHLPDYVESMFVLLNTPLYLAAQEHNCQAILSGFGGDQLVSQTGHLLLRELKYNKQYVRYLIEMLFNHGPKETILRTFKKIFLEKTLAHPMKPHRKIIRDCLTKRGKQYFDQRICPPYRTQREYTKMFFINGYLSGYIPSRVEMSTLLGDAYNLDVCYPMLDVDLVEYCYQCPTTAKAHFGRNRCLLRNSMRGKLPGFILQRDDKTAVALPAQMIALHNVIMKDENFHASLSKNLGHYLLADRVIDYLQRPIHTVISRIYVNNCQYPGLSS